MESLPARVSLAKQVMWSFPECMGEGATQEKHGGDTDGTVYHRMLCRTSVPLTVSAR